MKSIIVSILLLFILSICNAQQLPDLPTVNSNTSRLHSHNFIQQYLDDPAQDGRPNSYIINTTDIINYFNDPRLVNVTCYFHVYFGIDPADNTNTVQLVIIPTVPFPSQDPGSPILMHDPGYSMAFVPCVNSNMAPTFFYTPDNFDAASTAVAANVTQVSAPCQPINQSDCASWISNYQSIYSNTNENDYIQSFSFNAQKLRSFLTDPDNTVPFLQIYLGKNQNLNANLALENYTLIFMGLNTDGSHIPVNSTSITTVFGNRPMSFEACRPCPKCGIAPDQNLDNQPQAFADVIEKGAELMKTSAFKSQFDTYVDDLKNGKPPVRKTPVVRTVHKQKHCKTKRVARMQNRHKNHHNRYANRYNRKYNRSYPIKK